jgi:hypothetical protein
MSVRPEPASVERLERSGTIGGETAVIEGRAALILARILLGRNFVGGLTFEGLLAAWSLSPIDYAAALRALAALEEAGETYDRRFRIRGNAATRGNDEPLASSEPMVSSHAASLLLGCSERRVRQLATGGALPGVKTPRGWLFARSELILFRERRDGGEGRP